MANEEMYYLPVKDWYIEAFPSDDLGQMLPDTIGQSHGEFFKYDIEEDPDYANAPITFATYFTVLDNYGDVYDLMGNAADSVVRERIFSQLADIIGESYDYIYDQWLKCASR